MKKFLVLFAVLIAALVVSIGIGVAAQPDRVVAAPKSVPSYIPAPSTPSTPVPSKSATKSVLETKWSMFDEYEKLEFCAVMSQANSEEDLKIAFYSTDLSSQMEWEEFFGFVLKHCTE